MRNIKNTTGRCKKWLKTLNIGIKNTKSMLKSLNQKKLMILSYKNKEINMNLYEYIMTNIIIASTALIFTTTLKNKIFWFIFFYIILFVAILIIKYDEK